MRTKKTKPIQKTNRKSLTLLVKTQGKLQVRSKSFQSILKNIIASPE